MQKPGFQSLHDVIIYRSDVIGSFKKSELTSSTIISIQNFQLIWFYEQIIHMEPVTVPMFRLLWGGTTTQENFWILETHLRLVIQSETSLQKFQRYLNWYFVELIRLIGNGEEISTIFIDWNTWKIFFMMDILTRPWFFNIILLADHSANQKLRIRP